MKLVKVIMVSLCITAILGCSTQQVRQQDLDAWTGMPVQALELHPIFITIPVIKTKTTGGTEIWNYVNGRNIGTCSGGGSLFSSTVNTAAYSKFKKCISNVAACNNIFYIKDGIVLQYVAVGSGGLKCMTMKELQPQFRRSTNVN